MDSSICSICTESPGERYCTRCITLYLCEPCRGRINTIEGPNRGLCPTCRGLLPDRSIEVSFVERRSISLRTSRARVQYFLEEGRRVPGVRVGIINPEYNDLLGSVTIYIIWLYFRPSEQLQTRFVRNDSPVQQVVLPPALLEIPNIMLYNEEFDIGDEERDARALQLCIITPSPRVEEPRPGN